VGADNVLMFGLTADEVAERRRAGIDATATIAASPALAEVLDAIAGGVFSPEDRHRYAGLVNNLRHHDYFMVAADFDAYRAAQRTAGTLWKDSSAWWRTAVLNTARMGWFSADRTILDYARDIWRAEPGAH
jgi:starch phosphorylase